MGLEGVKDKKLLYHLTKLSNMDTIITQGLLPRRHLVNNRLNFGDVAVKKTYSSDKFVYICIKRALAEFNNFKVLIKHPLSQQESVLYDYSEGLNIVAKSIKEYQEYYGITTSQATFEQVYQVICSEKVDSKYKKLHVAVMKATEYVNNIRTDKKLEGVTTVLYLVQNGGLTNKEQIVEGFKNWSVDKADRFSKKYILECIEYLEETSIIQTDLCGNYILSGNIL